MSTYKLKKNSAINVHYCNFTKKKFYLQKLFQNTITEWQKSISNDKIPWKNIKETVKNLLGVSCSH